MKNKTVAKPTERIGSCKFLYERHKDVFMQMFKCDKTVIDKLLAIPDYNDACEKFHELISKYLNKQKLINLVEACDNSILTDLFEHLWFYRRNLHFCIESVPNIDIVNTSLLNEINRDICIDIVLGDKTYGVYAFHRTYPITTPSKVLDWTFQVYGRNIQMTNSNLRLVVQATLMPVYTFHIHADENTTRCYVEHNNLDTNLSAMACNVCKKCNNILAKFGTLEHNFKLYPMKYRQSSEDCLLARDLDTLLPQDILKCILHSLECYKAREVITRKNGKKAAAYRQCRVHIATNESVASDKFVVLPLHEYVKEYRASHPHEYKGGHHASPVAHVRRGYFRKSRKTGDYILREGQFIKVGKGQGNYSFVRATHVNNKTDRVTIYQTNTENKP